MNDQYKNFTMNLIKIKKKINTKQKFSEDKSTLLFT